LDFDYTQEPGRILYDKYDLTGIEPKISLITAFYNAGKYFEQTFISVLNQTFPYFEWLIIDDGSTNQNDIELLHNLAAKDNRITVYRIKNGGAAAARNYAVKRTTTDIFIPVDADDLIDPTFVEYMYWALKTNPDCSWAYADTVTFGGNRYLWSRNFTSEIMRKENVACITSAIRKDVFEDVGGYLPNSRNLYEDWKLWLTLLAKNRYPIQIKRFLFWYRTTPTSALSSIEKNPVLKEKILEDIHKLAKSVPDRIRSVIINTVEGKDFQKPYICDWDKQLKYKQNKIRILLIIPHMERGGADKFNIDIIANLDKKKYDISIITTVPAQSEWRQLFKEYIHDIFELPSFLRVEDWSAFIHYFIKSRSIDIVLNIASYYCYYLTPWLRKEFPNLGLVDCVHAEGKYWRSGGYPRASAAVDSILEKTYVTNEFTRKIIINSYSKNPEKCETIYTGVDENYFDRNKVFDFSVREHFRISDTRPVILYLCRINLEKRPFLMLEVADKLRLKIPDVCFLVVGEGLLLEELKAAIIKRDLTYNIIITGAPKDTRPYYAASDLFLITSIKEGLAITTFEAMLMGLPVVSSDVGGQNELVTHSTGRLVPCLQDEEKDFLSRNYCDDEVNPYVDAICELLSDMDKLKEMGNVCSETILHGYTLSQMIKQLDDGLTAIKSENNTRKRVDISKTLGTISDMVDDYLTIFASYERLDYYTCSVLSQLIQAQEKNMRDDKRIRQIESMRTWRAALKYNDFMNNTATGRLIHKSLRFVWRALRKIRNVFRRH
jgi:glycosyltransferase involved in cell wall biosynthesis